MQYDIQLIGYITTFESLTRAKVKDVFFDDNLILTFVVSEGEGGKAIGKRGSNVKRLGNLLKKRIRIIEFANDAVEFTKNCLLPLVPRAIRKEDEIILIDMENHQQKAMLFGRNKSNFVNMGKIVKRYYNVGLKVV